MISRKFTAIAAGLTLTLGLAACGGEGAGSGTNNDTADKDPSELVVGVAMPTQTSERWIADGDAVKSGLENAGYQVDLQFADDDIPTQQEQIDQMVTKGVDALIIASIDGTALSTQLDAAGAANIPVIAYDRLINGNENVDFYVTFDNENVGVQQATSLLVGLGLMNEDGSEGDAEGPFNVELFAGSPDDNNATFFFNGAMKTLQPYIDDETLVVQSGQSEFGAVATQRWSQDEAQKRMENLLTSTYNSGDKVDGVLSPFDGISRGIISALEGAGYATDEMPVITGQDAEIASVKLINDGVQFATIFKDTRKLADQAVDAASTFLEGSIPEPNDTTSYNNGVKDVPSFLLESDIVYKDNIAALLVDSGYYTQAQVDAGQ
ncbi:multiple monosaccharide ABC transporter substrate-binding protein [Jonesia quinghaiensis]|uniref:multiple monosaccharide ABC transporter substrate-binding protein n=1 Tax=Jonesia quinghaiensis TaxID=262806 RepID=UPI00040C8D26|nr:multiple monosaccharide ABC transporter substrate-binding protein [Jonesia quinghaiensis]